MTTTLIQEQLVERIARAKRLGFWAEAEGLQEAALGLPADAYRFRDQAVRRDYRRGYDDARAMLGLVAA